MGKKIQEYFLYFMCYSVIGWCYESISGSCGVSVGVF